MTKRMLESGYKDYRERKDMEESTRKREDYEQVCKFQRDLELEKDEKRARKEDFLSHG